MPRLRLTKKEIRTCMYNIYNQFSALHNEIEGLAVISGKSKYITPEYQLMQNILNHLYNIDQSFLQYSYEVDDEEQNSSIRTYKTGKAFQR